MAQLASTEIEPDVQECIDHCRTTHDLVLQALGRAPEAHADLQAERRLLDCADLCAVAADLMSRSSALHSDVCGVCADACRAAAESLPGDTDTFPGLQEALEACIQSCQRMAEAV